MKLTTFVRTLMAACTCVTICHPQNFEAASIKPSTVHEEGTSWHSRLGYLVMKNQPLRRLVAIAYGFNEDQVFGGPKWTDSDRFNLEARADGPAKDPELLLMLQHLLAERFQLGVHRESNIVQGYALVPLKSRLKIRQDDTEGKSKWNSHRGEVVAERITMARLAESLGRLLGAPVVDATGVAGAYTFNLEWTSEVQQPAASREGLATDPAGPSLFDVLAQKLGLRLENRKLSRDKLVIDQAEKPSEN
jgi:uncharacterized protein (TIGR03435 family)